MPTTSSLEQSILSFQPISRIRRNHGLEHATLHILSERFPHTSMAGHSSVTGFWLLGDVPTEAVLAAAQEGLRRMNSGEHNLAIHPNCGTNFVAAGTVAGLAGAAAMMTAGRRFRDKLERLPLAAALATVGLILAQPLGLMLQERYTTSGIPGDLEIVKVIPEHRGSVVAHRVVTRGVKMAGSQPVVYLLHGEDDLAIRQFIESMQSSLGDSTMAEMNTSRLDGRSASIEDMETAFNSMPFLANRRLVILSNPSSRLASPAQKERFKNLLKRINPAVVVLLVEDHALTDEKDRRNNRKHWLERFLSEELQDRSELHLLEPPRGEQLAQRIVKLAKGYGGAISQPAAHKLAESSSGDLRLIDQDIQKLLAYVDYHRTIDLEDVQEMVGDQVQGNIFDLVDAIGNRQANQAQKLLHHLLDEQDAVSIFSMIIRQFRLILESREILDTGGQPGEVARILKIHPYVADKTVRQARKFSMSSLVSIYHRLLDLDIEMKTSEIEPILALDTFIAQVAPEQ